MSAFDPKRTLLSPFDTASSSSGLGKDNETARVHVASHRYDCGMAARGGRATAKIHGLDPYLLVHLTSVACASTRNENQTGGGASVDCGGMIKIKYR
jgi:hypothetical protein